MAVAGARLVKLEDEDSGQDFLHRYRLQTVCRGDLPVRRLQGSQEDCSGLHHADEVQCAQDQMAAADLRLQAAGGRARSEMVALSDFRFAADGSFRRDFMPRACAASGR